MGEDIHGLHQVLSDSDLREGRILGLGCSMT